MEQNIFHFQERLKTETEKREIKRVATASAIPILVLSAIAYFWPLAYLHITGILGIEQQTATKFVSDPAVSQLVQIVVSGFAFLVPFSLTALIMRKRISYLIPFNAPQKELWLPFFLIGVSFCAFANIATSVAGGVFEQMGFEYNVPQGEDPTGIFGFFLCVLSSAVVPALVEEFACRGILHGILARFGEGFALVVTAALFGAMHGNFVQIPFAFLVGLILGFIRVKTGSIWICVAVHFFNNFTSVIMSFLDFKNNNVESVIYVLYLVISLLLGVVGIEMLKKWNTDFFSFKNPESKATEKQKYKWFFSSALVVIFLAVCLLQSVLIF